jgi:hypothetical protein
MHTVCELKTFRRDALDAGMTQEEIDGLVDFLSRAQRPAMKFQGRAAAASCASPDEARAKAADIGRSRSIAANRCQSFSSPFFRRASDPI